mmetsp:Transcript_87760/g.281835  ORF Transcript_87760/g.281835 Transcript_87760/m.281835 type:complete len:154 (-) Transcript_87760:77-538(-)
MGGRKTKVSMWQDFRSLRILARRSSWPSSVLFLLGYFFVETFVSQDNNVLKVIAGAACSFCTLLLETCLLMVHESKETMIEHKRTQSDIREGQRKKKLAALKHAKKGAQAASDAAASETAADGPEARGGEEEDVDDKQGREQPKKGQHDKKED